jgi:hypothetical protein
MANMRYLFEKRVKRPTPQPAAGVGSIATPVYGRVQYGDLSLLIQMTMSGYRG